MDASSMSAHFSPQELNAAAANFRHQMAIYKQAKNLIVQKRKDDIAKNQKNYLHKYHRHQQEDLEQDMKNRPDPSPSHSQMKNKLVEKGTYIDLTTKQGTWKNSIMSSAGIANV